MESRRFTDIFIKRPVLATVVALLILLIGAKALYSMQVRQFPKLENAVITVTTAYPGAPAKLVEGFITTPLEKSISTAEGVDYVTSESTLGVSTITVHVRLNYPTQEAFTNISSAIDQVKSELPKSAEDPVVGTGMGSNVALMYVAYSSKQMSSEQITDYITRVVQPKLETVDGVAGIQVLGGQTFAMRIWLDPRKLAGHGVTVSDVTRALEANNFLSTAGKAEGRYKLINVSATTGLENAKQFADMVVKHKGNSLVRLKDLGRVQLGSQYYDSDVIFNGKRAIFVAINASPTANPLTVIASVRKLFPQMAVSYPPSLKSTVVYDATTYISDSIDEVIRTILEAAIIVILVIYLFLGSLRTVLIPMVTIPLSLIGVCGIMLALGYSINLLTLLAMVLAIGMVVDDAIVVVENIYRHIEMGKGKMEAAIAGAREIAFPIIAMTLTLVAVFAPIGFMTGLTGALFTEFAFTLAGAVLVSGVIALVLSPMMCSHLLKPNMEQQRFVAFTERMFEKVQNFYGRRLHNVLRTRPVMIVVAVVVLLSCFFLYMKSPQQLAPQEDMSALFMLGTAPQYANHDYLEKFTKEYSKIYDTFPQLKDYFIVNGIGVPNKAIAGMMLKPWNQRKKSQAEVMKELNPMLQKVAGLQTMVFPPRSLPGGGSFPIDFVLTTTASYAQLYQASEKLVEAAQASGKFIFIFNSLKYNNPEMSFHINRDKAAELGVSMQDIGNTLGYALSGAYVNRFNMDGSAYQVIPQLERDYRGNFDLLKRLRVTTASGKSIPLSTLVTLKQSVEPNSLTHFQQLHSTQLQGMMIPGVSEGAGLKFLVDTAHKVLPGDVTYNFAGSMRQFVQEGNSLMYTFIFSLIVIFLVLAAQFESFTDPIVILVSVPMSICGALIPLNLGLASVNIYTQIGLITLIGLISKHGILMVEFANKLQEEEGLSIHDAIQKAAKVRLRAILMTTFAMIFGVIPLIMATGAGAHSRFDIGLVIAFGMLIGTGFTLFIVPTMYTLLAKRHKKID